MAALTTAERNRRKRERKKREKQEQRKRLEVLEEQKGKDVEEDEPIEVEYVYVTEPLGVQGDKQSQSDEGTADATSSKEREVKDEASSGATTDDGDDMQAVLRRFQSRAAVVLVSDDESVKGAVLAATTADKQEHEDQDDEEDGENQELSKRKRKELERPSVAELKRRVGRADLVEAHDVTAPYPEFLLELKALPGTVPVPRHWGRKRKYLQGKRGIEKAPFKLPKFIVDTGICDMRDAASTSDQSQKQQNRARVAPKMSAGADVDYRTLHDAFFKHQNKPDSMTEFGDLYYEGKEFETGSGLKIQPGVLSTRLRDALGMTETSPTPWLINMQRYGPPPSYPNLTIPGLNAPIPAGCSYGYHHGGWGKPPVDPFGRPLYGGNPFTAAAETGAGLDNASDRNITSDGKTITKKPWGALPTATDYDEESSSSEDEDESSGEEMEEESDDEEEQIEEENEVQEPSVPPEGAESVGPGSAFDLRKTNTGDETPQQPKQLYQVLEQTSANKAQQAGAVFQSDVKYVLPEEGAESVLSKAMPGDATTSVASKRKRRDEDDEDDDTDLTKKFKF